MVADALDWILESDEPWARYRVLADIGAELDRVEKARLDMLDHPAIKTLVARAAEWPGYALKRHNDAAHPIYAVSTLADFGLTQGDPGMDEVTERILDHFDGEGFESLLWLPKFLTKDEDDERMAWMLCDGPTLLYSLLSFGLVSHPNVQTGVAALIDRVDDNAWRCGAAASIPKFGGPGRKGDTCPMATTYVLKALSLAGDHPGRDEAVAAGVEALLSHWENQKEYKLKMFGIGTEFRKLKYPFVWYDLLHVADVLSRFDAVHSDKRFAEMVGELTTKADGDGRYTAESMYRAWKDWSFADKKRPSPWLTALVLRIEHRMAESARTPGN